MRRHGTAIDRRGFLRQSAALGLGTLFAPAFTPKAWAATKDRIVIYQGVSLDSLHRYGYSGALYARGTLRCDANRSLEGLPDGKILAADMKIKG